MAINFTEKQHWKNRIEAKLNQRIDQLRSENAMLLANVTAQAREEVLSSLELIDDFKNFARVDKEIERLEVQRTEIILAMQAKVCDEDPSNDSWALRRIEAEIKDLQRERADELLQEHDLGRKLAVLKAEKEKLSDAVLLATSVNQIIDLWDRVTVLVSGQDAEPQQEMLFSESEEPSEDDDDA